MQQNRMEHSVNKEKYSKNIHKKAKR